MKKSVLLSSLVFGIVAMSSMASARGGSSVAGPGTPEFMYGCFEMDHVPNELGEAPPQFEVSVGRFWPTYDLKLTVIDRFNETVDSELATVLRSSRIGGPLTISAETYGLDINTTSTPIVEDGHVYHSAELSRFGIKARDLKCEYLGK